MSAGYTAPMSTSFPAGLPASQAGSAKHPFLVIFVIALAAAEAAVGLALIIAVYRSRRTVELEQLDMLQG